MLEIIFLLEFSLKGPSNPPPEPERPKIVAILPKEFKLIDESGLRVLTDLAKKRKTSMNARKIAKQWLRKKRCYKRRGTRNL